MRSAHNKHYETVLKFWRAIEIFNFPEGQSKSDGKNRREVDDLKPGDQFPWQNEGFPKPSPGKRWLHTLYICPTPKQNVIELINKYLKGASQIFRSRLKE